MVRYNSCKSPLALLPQQSDLFESTRSACNMNNASFSYRHNHWGSHQWSMRRCGDAETSPLRWYALSVFLECTYLTPGGRDINKNQKARAPEELRREDALPTNADMQVFERASRLGWLCIRFSSPCLVMHRMSA
jgi:hypothetical protein